MSRVEDIATLRLPVETAMSGVLEGDDDPRKRLKELENALEHVEERSDLRGEGNSPEMARKRN